jgi:hypothetical protein
VLDARRSSSRMALYEINRGEWLTEENSPGLMI